MDTIFDLRHAQSLNRNWCTYRRLQLKENNTELALFGKRSRLNKLVNMEQTVTVGASVIHPAAAVRDLGVLLDQELSMTQHIAKKTSSCFCQLRQLRQTPSCPVGQELVAQMVNSFVLSRQFSFSLSAKVGDHAAATRSEHSSAVDSRPTDERTRDTSSEAAPLVTRRPSSGLQIEHHDALNPHRSVSNVFFRHGACRRRQPDEVRSVIRRHRSIH